ncbi:MAG: 3-deoxy-D-manno-octulosonic acid transferase, partial [Candidatus Cloacimonetes bacterium]|nr:3-deoxy-D-manno-octulosonic acid transferase [Candidatus Cloacimonadota bacterium]
MIIYKLMTNLIFYLSYPFILFRLKGRERKERLGHLINKFEKSIWIHAASVGEVNAIKTLINELLNKYPQKDFVLSTTTATGQDIARKISPKLTAFFFPIDIDFVMKRVFNSINPELIILVETEFWPNMLHIAKKRKIPIILINGRLSDKSFPGYRRFKFFWKPIWKSIVAVNAQSDKDTKRFIGFRFNNVVDTHNLKFCINLPSYKKNKLRKELGYSEDDFILVWGSSRPGEEKLLKNVFSSLGKEIYNFKVIVVPRHLHRLPEIKEIFKDFDYKMYSELKITSKVLIVDEMGVLNMFYALADVAVVGGSFYNFGGHNPLEPAFYSTPTIIGKYHSSCHDSVDRLNDNNGIIISDR